MCMSRLHVVRALKGPGVAEVEDLAGSVHDVSLLALDGPAPLPGSWLVVHSGYALGHADPVEAERVALEWAAAAEAATPPPRRRR